jgi:hypothetical protein
VDQGELHEVVSCDCAKLIKGTARGINAAAVLAGERGLKRIALVIALSSALSSIAVAQSSGTPRVGDEVRFKARARSSLSDTSLLSCEGKITRLLLDTLVVRPFGQCRHYDNALVNLRDVDLARNRGSRARHLLAGVAIGGIAGGVAGFLLVGDGCKKGYEDCDGGLAQISWTLGGIIVGGLSGGAIGAFIPAGLQWRPLPNRPARLDDRL